MALRSTQSTRAGRGRRGGFQKKAQPTCSGYQGREEIQLNRGHYLIQLYVDQRPMTILLHIGSSFHLGHSLYLM